MAGKRLSTTNRIMPLSLPTLFSILAFGALLHVFNPFSSLSSRSYRDSSPQHKVNARKFEIAEDMFWRDGEPFQIIGGDIHYFRVIPEYWEDRLLRAKALGLNTIQTYVPWNLHQPKPGKKPVFDGIADIISFLKICQKHNFLVMLRPGPYICGEWDLGGFPAWLLSIKPVIKLRSSDPAYLKLVDKWWGILLPKISPLLYENGGPIVMVQIENEYGSYGDDKAYLHHLISLARLHLGNNIILYTTDGGTREVLEKGTIRGDAVYSAVDFSTGDDPWPIFKLQKEFNSPGKSPPLSAEFYTGWLTHWRENIAKTDADFTASELKKILSRNGSAVLYMVHGGTNFGFYNGANTAGSESAYQPDLTSYDYDAPIKESGDVDSAKFKAIRRVIGLYSGSSLPIPPNMQKTGYGPIRLQRMAFLFDLLNSISRADVVEYKNPRSMESVGQMFGFLLYVSRYPAKDDEQILFIPKVHDRAQVFILCPSRDNGGRPTYVGTIDRWSNKKLVLPNVKCTSNISLFVLVENMGRVNYGEYIFDPKGILSYVYLDGKTLRRWKMIEIPFHNLNEKPETSSITQDAAQFHSTNISRQENFDNKREDGHIEPAVYVGQFSIDKETKVTDTFISFTGWSKGIAFINDFNIGRYWPSFGPQCNLYVPGPLLRHGENNVLILELESPPNSRLVIDSVDQPYFNCSSIEPRLGQL